jgi:hypothetical protein
MEVEHEEREKQFLANLSEQHGKVSNEIFENDFHVYIFPEIALRRISEIYREKMAATEKSYLQQRQTVSRRRLHLESTENPFSGNAYSRSDDVGVGRETHPREASTFQAAC